MKRYLFLFMIVCLASVMGCATTYDLRRVQGKLNLDIQSLKEENASIRKDIDKAIKNIEKVNEAITDVRKRQADINADTTEIRDYIQNLRGDRDVIRKDISALKVQMTREDEEYKNIKKKLDQMASEVNPGGKILDIGKNENHPEEAGKGGKIASKNTVTGKIDKESVYTSAYKTFKEGKYDEARTGFRNFLKQFPNTEYSDRAQFWVGECYYFEKKYEEAILEYEKVIKNYPNGNKVSSALLKQGFSFLNLGDRPSAKLLLQQVVKDYPNTNQARIARVKLLEIK